MSGRLAGRTALVTGAAHGIGRATAEAFSAEGARVALLDADAEALERVASGLSGPLGSPIACTVDVSREDEVEAAVDAVVREAGRLDVAVANAAVFVPDSDGRAHEVDAEFWRRALDVNVTGVFFTCRHAVRAMLASGGGSIICTGSPTGTSGGHGAGFTAYATGKAAVHQLVRVLAVDYAADGIRVNAVIPGFTRTRLTEYIIEDPELLEAALARVPLGRPGEPADVAPLMVFLASDEAAYCTGGIYPADGGTTTA
jgi:NAD(P)-dependent dehydrogenase (short-subunit alcohol dehydrogenase family)